MTMKIVDGVRRQFSVSPMVPSLPSSTPLPGPKGRLIGLFPYNHPNTEKQEVALAWTTE